MVRIDVEGEKKNSTSRPTFQKPEPGTPGLCSLNKVEVAMKASGWDINQYDVLPDRLIVYLWPHAGGTKFSFTFRPRYGLKALTAPSILYDYYNPEAHAVVQPTQFTVQ
jgi:hypothetical protein